MHVVPKGYIPSEHRSQITTTIITNTTATANTVKNDISIITQEIPINIYLIKCMGGVCGSSRDTIRGNLDLLKSVGNTRHFDVGEDNDNEVGGDGTVTGNVDAERSFPVMIESIYEMVAVIFHGDTNNLSEDGQIDPFVTAAMFLIPFLLLGFVFAMMSLLVQFLPLIMKRIGIKECMNHSILNRHCHGVAKMINGTNSYLSLLMSAMYPSLTWNHIFDHRGARFGMGYKIMVLYTVIDCLVALGILSRCFGRWNDVLTRVKRMRSRRLTKLSSEIENYRSENEVQIRCPS